MTFKELQDRLVELHAEGKWPPAPWAHAKQEPYDTGTRQHLYALWDQGKGIVEREEKPGFYPIWRATLVKHAREALELREEGKTYAEIASALGISVSRVGRVITDPTGQKERDRKKAYCPGCGTKKEPESDWCPKCVGSKVQALMPPAEESTFWQNAMMRSRRRGVEFVIGVTPDLSRIIRVDTGRGRFDRVLRANEDYEAVAEELGLL
jgi:hypothetical protein